MLSNRYLNSFLRYSTGSSMTATAVISRSGRVTVHAVRKKSEGMILIKNELGQCGLFVYFPQGNVKR